MKNPYLTAFEQTYVKPSLTPATPWSIREILVRKYSWAVPNEEAITQIRRLELPIIEWGAGSGYWASLLHQEGCNIQCYDKEPWATTYHPVTKQDDPSKMNFEGKMLLLVWPPYADPMADEVLKQYLLANAHPVVAYVGESCGGCTGDDAYHKRLHRAFGEPDNVVAIPNYAGIHDNLYIYKRL